MKKFYSILMVGCMALAGTFTAQANQEETGDPTEVYMIGSMQDWNLSHDGDTVLRLQQVGESSVYEGEFPINTSEVVFRFLTKLSWDPEYSIGSALDDFFNLDIALTDGVYSGTAVRPGRGNWNITNFEGNVLKVSLNLETLEVKFQGMTSSVEGVLDDSVALSYQDGVVTTTASTDITVVDAGGRTVAKVKGDKADLNTLPGGIYIVKAGDKVMKVAI